MFDGACTLGCAVSQITCQFHSSGGFKNRTGKSGRYVRTNTTPMRGHNHRRDRQAWFILYWLLVCLIVMGRIHAVHGFRARIPVFVLTHSLYPTKPPQHESKFQIARFFESISVICSSPQDKAVLASQIFNGRHFIVGNPFREPSKQQFCQSWGDETNAWSDGFIWQWKVEVVGDWIRQDANCGPEGNIISGSASTVCQNRTSFKNMVLVLKNGRIECGRQISAPSQFGYEFLTISDFSANPNAYFHRLSVGIHALGNAFHSSGGSSGFSDGRLHVTGLAFGNFFHLNNGLLQTESLYSEDNSLDQSYKSNESSKSYHPPVGIRLVFSSLLLLGGFFISLWGWENLDYNRGVVGSAKIITGHFLSAIGVITWLTL